MDDLTRIVDLLGRRLRFRDYLHASQRSLWIACLAAVSIQIIGRLMPIEGLDIWTFAPILIWLVYTAGYAALKPMPRIQIARAVDLENGLKERLSTAIALDHKPSGDSLDWGTAQFLDALSYGRRIQPDTDLPITWHTRSLILAAILSICIGASFLLPNRMDWVLAEREAVRSEAAKQAEEVLKLAEEIEASQVLTEEERQELLKRLEELANQLRENRGDAEQALADLSELEESIQAMLDKDALAKQANLRALADRLADLAKTKTEGSKDNASAVADALASLAEQFSSMNNEQKEAAANAMAQMAAQAAQSGDQDLAKALAELAQAIQSGNADSVQNAADNASQAAANTQKALEAQGLLQQALAQMQSSQEALAQVAAQAGSQAMAANSNASGQPGGNQPASQGNTQGTTGGGTTANTLPPSTRPGTPGRPQGTKPGSTGETLQNQVYYPRQQGQSEGNELAISGQETGQGETQSSQGTNPSAGITNPSLVPFYEVYYQYLSAMNQAIGNSYIPISLQDYIRIYFLQLGLEIEGASP